MPFPTRRWNGISRHNIFEARPHARVHVRREHRRVVAGEDVAHALQGARRGIHRPLFLPQPARVAVGNIRQESRVLHALHGVPLVGEHALRPHLGDEIEGQVFFAELHAALDALEHLRDFVIDHRFGEIKRHQRVEQAADVEHIRAAEQTGHARHARFVTGLRVYQFGVGQPNVAARGQVVIASHLRAGHVQDAGLDGARGVRARSHVGHRRQSGVDRRRAWMNHLRQYGFGQKFGVALRQCANQCQRRRETGIGDDGGVARKPTLGGEDEHFGRVEVHRQRRHDRAVVQREEGAFFEGGFASGNDRAQFQHLLEVFRAGRVATNRFGAVFQRRIKAGERELAWRGVFGQGRDREHIEGRQFVEEVRDAGDVVRGRPPLMPRFGINDVRRGTASDDDRPVVGQGAIVLRVAGEEGELGRQEGAEFFDHRARECYAQCF